MWLMLQQENPDDYVIATGKSHSVREFLELVFDRAGLNINEHVKIDERLFRPHEVPYLLGDPTRARKKLNWTPKVSFKDLAIMMYESDLKNINKGVLI